MRVIGGEFRSRKLASLPGLDTRPTPDRLREALFNVLAPRIEQSVFVDLYAGTGAVGVEALSRGAARVLFVEANRAAVGVIRANLKSLGVEARAEVRQGKVGSLAEWLGGHHADIVFLDPPYRLDPEYDAALEMLGAEPPGLVIVQHDVRRKLEESYGGLVHRRRLRQGDNCLSFFEPEPGESDAPDAEKS